MKSLLIRLLAVFLTFFLFTGCALNKAQKSITSTEQKSWSELFDSNSWDSVNKTDTSKEVM